MPQVSPYLKPVTDPAILAQLNAPNEPNQFPAKLTLRDGRVIRMPAGLTPEQVGLIADAATKSPPAQNLNLRLTPVTDPAILAQLNAPDPNFPIQEKTNREAGPPATGFLPSLKVGVQATGRGLADIAGAPVDLMTGAINAGSGLVNSTALPAAEFLGSWLAGQDVELPRIPRVTNAIGGSDNIADMAETGFEAFGGEAVERDDMTDFQKLGYDVDRYTTQAAVSGATLAKTAAGKAANDVGTLLRPYTQGNVGRTLAGDTAGGAGAGVAMNAYEEHMPDEAKGPLTSLLAVMLGGIGGSTAMNLVESPATMAKKLQGWLPDSDPVLRDPETGNAPRTRNADQAAQYLQKGASDSAAASEAIAKNQSYFEEVGGAAPTTGLMSDDLGLQMLEKSQRIADPKPFLERDKAVRTSAAHDLETIRPADGDPNVSRALARDIVDTKRGAANDAVKSAEANVHGAEGDERALMQEYRPFAGGGSVASEDLDKVLVGETMKPMQKRKNDLFAAVDPEGDIMRSTDPLVRLAAALRGETEGLPPSVQREVLPETLLKDLEATSTAQGGTGEMSFRDLNDTRAVISSMEQQARAAGQSPLADTLQRFKNTINQDGKALAADGSEAGNRAMAADTYYRDTFAPLFSEGEGGKLRKDINRDDLARSNTPPTATGRRFLREGAGGAEAAGSLQRILAAAPNPPAGADAARRFVLDDLARTVGADGKVSETSLRKWINARSGMLSQIPAIDKEVRGLLQEASGRSAKTGAMKLELERASAGLKRTEKEIDQSALSLLIDADPRNAAASVMRSSDPVAAATELQATFAGNKAAERGWRAAVADHLIESLGTSSKAGIADDIDAVSLDKLATYFRKNEATLKVVFGEDMKHLQQARRRLELLSKKAVQAARGGEVPKSGLVTMLKKPLDVVLRLTYGALEGGSRMRKYNVLAEQLPDTTSAANELVKRAMFDPEVAKHLLTRPVEEVAKPAWNKKLNRLMGWAEAGRESGETEDRFTN